MDREQAFKWIKRNWKKLAAEGKLEEAMKRYMERYFNSTEDDAAREHSEDTLREEREALRIFDGTLL